MILQKLSYQRAIKAADSKLLDKEITPITIKGKRGKPDILMSEDEEIRKANFDKFGSLPTVFDIANGTITAANVCIYLLFLLLLKLQFLNLILLGK